MKKPFKYACCSSRKTRSLVNTTGMKFDENTVMLGREQKEDACNVRNPRGSGFVGVSLCLLLDLALL